MSDTPDIAKTPVKRSKGLKIALVVSLAFNLLIIGLIVGAMTHRWREPEMRDDRAVAEMGFAPYVGALEPADRRALGRELMKRAGDFKRNREEIKAEFARITAILRAPEFDAEAFRASLMAQGSKFEERRATGIELLIESVSAMDKDKRAAFADRLDRLNKRFKP